MMKKLKKRSNNNNNDKKRANKTNLYEKIKAARSSIKKKSLALKIGEDEAEKFSQKHFQPLISEIRNLQNQKRNHRGEDEGAGRRQEGYNDNERNHDREREIQRQQQEQQQNLLRNQREEEIMNISDDDDYDDDDDNVNDNYDMNDNDSDRMNNAFELEQDNEIDNNINNELLSDDNDDDDEDDNVNIGDELFSDDDNDNNEQVCTQQRKRKSSDFDFDESSLRKKNKPSRNQQSTKKKVHRANQRRKTKRPAPLVQPRQLKRKLSDEQFDEASNPKKRTIIQALKRVVNNQQCRKRERSNLRKRFDQRIRSTQILSSNTNKLLGKRKQQYPEENKDVQTKRKKQKVVAEKQRKKNKREQCKKRNQKTKRTIDQTNHNIESKKGRVQLRKRKPKEDTRRLGFIDGATASKRRKLDRSNVGGSLKNLTNNKIAYIYWDDVNEIVERLLLLHSSRSAGNSNLENEILSIESELKERNIIR